MNKELRELLNRINSLKNEIQNLIKDDKLDEAKNKKAELDELQAKFDILKDVMDEAAPKDPVPVDTNDPVHEFANAARHLFRNASNNEGTGADGGYTVPQDIQTRINKFKEARFSLENLVSVESVSTMSGRRTFQAKTQHAGFSVVAEEGKIGQSARPQFSVLSYAIKKFAGYLPVTNELLEDSDVNITNTLIEWLGEEDIATKNREILAVLQSGSPETVEDLDTIKTWINVTLGSAYAGFVKILTNDDGLNYLDTLKDENGQYLLKPSLNPDAPLSMTLAVGARNIPIVVVPNGILQDVDTYALTADATLVSGKTYYTRSGSGTAESPYVYTAVASPDVTNIATYYEKTVNIPFIAGDLKEAVQIFDRKRLSIMPSNVASVTGFNAFEQDMTLFRGIERLDVKARDTGAWVYGILPMGE